jgi:hypothetical protein
MAAATWEREAGEIFREETIKEIYSLHIASIDEKEGKKEEEMNLSLQGAALWHHLKQAGLVLIFIGALVLLGWVGVGISHAHQAGVPTGGLMAPVTGPNDPPPLAA